MCQCAFRQVGEKLDWAATNTWSIMLTCLLRVQTYRRRREGACLARIISMMMVLDPAKNSVESSKIDLNRMLVASFISAESVWRTSRRSLVNPKPKVLNSKVSLGHEVARANFLRARPPTIHSTRTRLRIRTSYRHLFNTKVFLGPLTYGSIAWKISSTVK